MKLIADSGHTLAQIEDTAPASCGLPGSMHYERAARVWNARAGGSSRKISERVAFYLEGKTPLSANDLSPKEATV